MRPCSIYLLFQMNGRSSSKVSSFVMLTFLGDPLDEILGKCWGHFVSTTLTVFYCITVDPLVIRLCMGKTAAE